MSSYPDGVLVDIVDVKASNRGRSYEEHAVCGACLELDYMVWFKVVQVVTEVEEKTAITLSWVTDGVNWCRVGFLPRHLVKHIAS